MTGCCGHRWWWAFLDTTAPTVSSTTPADAATDVTISANVTATFSEALDPATITVASFTVTGPGATSVAGTVTYAAADTTATFEPASPLAVNTTFTATLTTEITDLAGNALASDFVWSFTTGATADTTAPTVTSTNPASAAIGVAINRKITATFSEALDPATITAASFTVTGPGATSVAGTVTYAAVGATATFAPASQLALNTTFTATLATGITDLAGNALASDFVWSFTTGATADATAPTVTSTNPASAAIGVAINSKIAATFSEALDPATITAASFTVTGPGATSVAGTITYAAVGTTATFAPASQLALNTTFTATLTTGITDLAGNALASDFVWSFTTGATTDTTAPTVTSTNPASAAIGVAINSKVAATFSEALDPLTVTTATFTLRHGATPVSGTVTYAGTIATFTPASNLAPGTAFTATLATGITDLADNALASNFVWSFTTGATADTTAPTVTSTDPANAATGVAINKKVAATFSEALDALTVTTATFTLRHGATPVSGTVTCAGTIATFTPASTLAPGTTFTATLTTGITDLAENALASNFVWSFTTGTSADTTAPTVISTNPADAATGVAINRRINAAFSEALDPLTITTATFALRGPGITPVLGTVAYDVASRIATLTPTSDLALSTTFTATLTTGIRDLAGNALASNFVWHFTTGTEDAQAPAPLGSANAFAVLAGSTVTNTGPTILNGDLGVSPGTAVTGFPPGIVHGTIHAGDSAAAQAKLDLTTAYNDAAGRSTSPITVSGNLGGQTLAPGLYKSTSSLAISSGDLTLDAQGDANAVFIFQMASTLTTTVGRQIILSGGAKAANVFWQVGTSATLGTNSVFQGNILADQSITLTTGATLNGRALTRIGAVALDSNAITTPAP
jgi:methionine-rich copper-binding protein CopC